MFIHSNLLDMSRIFVFVFLLICGVQLIKAQADAEGVPCETPNDEYGLCINIHNCSYLINLLVTQSNSPRVRTFLRASTCGYINQTPLVCCPQSKIEENVNPPVTSTTTQTPSSRTPRTNTIYTLPRIPDCGHSDAKNTRVVNGNPAELGEFPWIVALGYRNSKNPNLPKWLCGATLITDRHVLTAAHCVKDRNDLYLARLGDLDLYDENDGAHPENIPIVKMKIHENYNSQNFTNDIAILTLERSPRKSTSAWPVCLPVENNLRSSNFIYTRPTVAGWGSVYFNGPTSPILREVALPVLDNQNCAEAYGSQAIIDEKIICAGYIQGGKDACKGDSGGPLMHRQADADKKAIIWYYQIGVVSYGRRCAEAKYPGVYTRVTAFLDWIEKNIN